MCNARKYIGLIVITILALASLVFAESLKIKGDVAGFDPSSQTLLVSTSEGFVRLNLAGSVMKRNGIGILPEDFLIGERVVGTYNPTSMNAIQLLAKGGYTSGYITSIRSTLRGFYEVTVTTIRSKPMTFQINEKTILVKNGVEIKVFDYKVGDYATVFYIPKQMVAVKFMGIEQTDGEDPIGITVKGYIVKIEISGQLKGLSGRVTISSGIGELLLMNVDSRTQITLDGAPALLNTLEVGNSVVANYAPNGHASSISATRQKNLDICTGNIVSIKIKGDFVPVVELVVKAKEYPQLLVFDLPLSAEVWKDGKRARMFDLKTGDFATILYDEFKMDIVRIEAWTVSK